LSIFIYAKEYVTYFDIDFKAQGITKFTKDINH